MKSDQVNSYISNIVGVDYEEEGSILL